MTDYNQTICDNVFNKQCYAPELEKSNLDLKGYKLNLPGHTEGLMAAWSSLSLKFTIIQDSVFHSSIYKA